ncbi:hypothetical protein [Solirubrobacter ginsenosidimutans]|nr:hypothetical protein [Solirubrobacter ginsenosidimutans]
MTERRRPLDNDDRQESLFGGEAFALKPGATAPWQRPAPEPEAARAPEGPRGEAPSTPVDEVQAGVFDAPAAVEFESGPTAEDLAAYTRETAAGTELLAGPVPTEVPVQGADLELETLERATLARQDVRRPRAPLTGPTLDDVMSRVWEGLATGLPAACPVCRGEVVASFAGSLHGSCSSCGTTIE